ncbi:alpha-L-rhamnosidase [Catalinimonas alkaloidigena]|uniref:Alpha-L-rhamnosidase n=1 Tax=Catalinimonas alkaloidigena TaxID=1075417 RepID=A0A1G9KZK6_9BACT|nr:glycosyl hydrolase [Catalinimonas alkaloidigena]SDL54877.1 alpha-L-rhamnosidase [Catalinimonas alkaloidigena]
MPLRLCLLQLLLIIAFRPLQAQPITEGALSESTFTLPPDQYGIRCWWWWLNGNVTKEVITRDLEAIKAKGFSGACIFDAGGAEQRGNAQVPEGPMFGSPAWQALYLHAVQEANRLGLVLSMSIQSGWNLGGPDVTPAEAAKQLTWSEVTVKGPMRYKAVLHGPPSKDEYYRDITVMAFPKPAAHVPIQHLPAKAGIVELGGSAPDTRFLLTDTVVAGEEAAVQPAQIVNLTDRMDAQGRLEWKVPKGEWTIMRFGYTPTGAEVSTSSGQWQGRVLDPLSADKFNRYWNTHVEPLLKLIGPMAGKTLKYLQTDSWEAGGCNWTETFAQEFEKRRGYSLWPYLPVVAGQLVENRDVSNRFLADLRKTISDCVAENHYAVFAERARQYGIGLQPESAGPHAGPFDGLKNYGYSEIMMSEFWAPSPHRPLPHNRFFVKQAASAAHIYDKKLVGAESFTTIGPHWNDVIWKDMKSSADHEFCAGLNLVFLHTFTASPKAMGLPGQEYFAGTHFNPNVTWWNYADGFIKYLKRCQYLLQEGKSTADVLYYYGDHVPNIARQKADDPAQALPEFDYDVINEDRLLDLDVENGRVVLPQVLSYRLLVLPDHRVLSLAALRKVAELVEAGATVLGPKPRSTASLVDYPESVTELQTLADRLWGTGESAKGEQKTGKGRVVWGKTAREVLLAEGVKPDAVLKGTAGQVFDYFHKTWNGDDYYFVSNQTPETVQLMATFRVSERQPELWDATTGTHRPARAFREKGGQTTLPLTMPPYGSVFVVFRQSIPSPEQGTAPANYPSYAPVSTLSGPWEVTFDPKWVAGDAPTSVTFDSLVSWTTLPQEGLRYYSGVATYRKKFDAPAASDSLYLDLGDVKDVGVARVRLNGEDLGLVWAPPFRVPVPPLKKQGNQLEIEVVNTWRNRLIGDSKKPKDQQLTNTNITVTPAWKLEPSGLLGPVRLIRASLP